MQIAGGTLALPDIVGNRYKISGFLGKGGAGEVYQALDLKLKRKVALKFLQVIPNRPELRERFSREANVLSRLSHPHICTLYDLDYFNGTAYLILEYIQGEDLAKRLQNGPLPPDTVLQCARELVDALDEAHRQGVVHRDLKPSNIMSTKAGTKLLDFGMAQISESACPFINIDSSTISIINGSLTNSDVIVGTVPYMSPEQVKAQSVDRRSDIFSFGSVLYEMLTGQRAFRGSSTIELIAAILKDDPTRPSGTHPALPPKFHAVVQRCLEKEPEKRFQFAADLLDALNGLSGTSVAIGNQGAAVASPRSRRNRGESKPPYPGGPLTFQRLTFGGSTHRARFSVDAKTVLYTGSAPGLGQGVFVSNVSNLDVQQLPLPPESYLVSVSCHGELALLVGDWSLEGRRLVRSSHSGRSIQLVLDGVVDADWSPDGSSLAVLRRIDGKSRIEFPIGHVLYEKPAHPAAAIYGLRVSPDGRRLAFFEYIDSVCVLATVDSSGHRRVLSSVAKGGTSVWELCWHSSHEIWFSAPDTQQPGIVYSVNDAGERRVVDSFPGACTLMDLSEDRTMLLNVGRALLGIGYKMRESTQRDDLSFLDASWLSALSSDGKTIIITELDQRGASEKTIFLKRVAELSPLTLGHGFAQAISRDARWVLAARSTPRPASVLIPTESSQEHVITRPGGHIVAFRADERCCLLWRWATKTKGQFLIRDYFHDKVTPVRNVNRWIERPNTTVFGDDGSGDGFILAQDNQHFAVSDPTGTWHVYSLGTGTAREIGILTASERPLNWYGNRRALFVTDRIAGKSLRVYKLDLSARKRRLWAEIAPTKPDAGIYNLRITPNGKYCAYNWNQLQSDLYVATVPHDASAATGEGERRRKVPKGEPRQV